MEAFDIVLKALLVLATLVVWLSPVTWLSLALSDVNMKVAIVTVVVCIALFDPVLALIVMAFFITVLIHAPAPSKAGAILDLTASAKAAAYVTVPSVSEEEPRQRVVAPEGDSIAGRVLGSHPEKPPLGWSEEAIAPPTGEELLQASATMLEEADNMDADLRILCGVPNERLRDIQDASVPGAKGCGDDADEDTGMALVGASTMLLR